MKLTDPISLIEVTLPNDLYWSDEFDWTPIASRQEYTLGGALVVELSTKLAGRPITLKPPQEDMAWVTRAVLTQLQTWAAVAGKELELLLEYPTDTRSFTVTFRPGEPQQIEAKPVKNFPGHATTDLFLVTIKLTEV